MQNEIMYTNDNIWKQLQEHLPEKCRIDGNIFPKEEYINYDNSRIHFDIYTPDNSKNNITVILFHGVGGNGRLLSFFAVPLVKQGFAVIAPDLPGYGYTEYNGAITYQSWIDVGNNIVKSEIAEGKKVFLMGLSAGGMLAYNIACLNENISGLILTCILDNREKEVVKYSAKNEFMGTFGLAFLKKMPLFIKKIKVPMKMVTNMNAIVNSKDILKVLLKDKRGAGVNISLLFMLSMMEYKPLLEAEDFKNVPVLMVHPKDDKWTPVFVSELFFDKIGSNKKKIILENAGHFPVEEPGVSQLINGIIEFIGKSGK